MKDFVHSIFELLPIAAVMAIWAYVWVHELTAGDGIFAWLSMWMDKVLPWWLSKPLVGCEQCHAGQVAMWIYLACYWYSYNPFTHIAFITLTIFFTVILTACLTKLKK